MIRTVHLAALSCVALFACTRPAQPVTDIDSGVAERTDAAVASQHDTGARDSSSIGARVVPVALALSAERSLVVVTRQEHDDPQDEILPSAHPLGIRSLGSSSSAPPREIAMTPAHRVFTVTDGRASPVALAPATASLVVLDTRALIAIPSDESQPIRKLTQAQWQGVDPSLQALLRRSIGEGETAHSVAPEWVTTTGPQPLAVFATCTQNQHAWGGPPCTVTTADTNANAPVSLNGEPQSIDAASAANGAFAVLRARCGALGEVLRCPLEALVTHGRATSNTSLGWQAMRTFEGNSSDGWRSITPWQDTVVAAWASQDRPQQPRYSLRLAKLDARSRRWTFAPPIACEQPCMARAVGGQPLTVLWTHEFNTRELGAGGAQPTHSLSTLGANNRWSTVELPAFAGTAVDALVLQEPAGPIVYVLVAIGSSGAAVVRRAPSGEWQTIPLPAQ